MFEFFYFLLIFKNTFIKQTATTVCSLSQIGHMQGKLKFIHGTFQRLAKVGGFTSNKQFLIIQNFLLRKSLVLKLRREIIKIITHTYIMIKLSRFSVMHRGSIELFNYLIQEMSVLSGKIDIFLRANYCPRSGVTGGCPVTGGGARQGPPGK